MSSVECWGGLGPGVEAPVDDAGDVAFERRACFAGRLSFPEFAGEVGACWWVVTGLDNRDALEGGVELAVAASVEAVASGGLS
jgi:hypothetical protein